MRPLGMMPARGENASANDPTQKLRQPLWAAFVISELNAVYWGFLRTGGFLAGAGAALVNSAPFSITITKGLGV